MKIKFTRIEKIAGIFVISAVGMMIASLVMMSARLGWFERSVSYSTVFTTADGIFPGTEVQMAGLRVGSVDEVNFDDKLGVQVKFSVREKYASKLREDTILKTVRPFLIGNKILDLTPGTPSLAALNPGTVIKNEVGLDLSTYMASLSGMIENIKILAEAFADKNRTRAIVEIFDDLKPLMHNLTMVTGQVAAAVKPLSKDHQLEKAVSALVQMTILVGQALPELTKAMKDSPQLTRQMIQMVSDLSVLTSQMAKILPALGEVAPELPKASHRAIEAMNEAVVVLKAMQKTFLLRSSVQEVREEESKRAPAKTDKP